MCHSVTSSYADRDSQVTRYKMDRFNDSQMLHLAEIYRDYECLWNVNNALYKNRAARERVYQEIADKLNIPGVTARDIPKKIKNLRSSYYQELKKIDKSIQSGADQDTVYTPKVSWFAIIDGVLSAINNKQEAYLNIDENSKNSDNDSETHNTQAMEHIKVEENSNPSDEEIEDYSFPESNHVLEISSEACASRFAVPYKKPIKYREKTIKKDEDISKAIAEIDKIANRIMGRSSSRLERDLRQEDEFDVYGRYIATVLRSLPGELAVRAKINVQKSLSDFQLTALRTESEILYRASSK